MKIGDIYAGLAWLLFSCRILYYLLFVDRIRWFMVLLLPYLFVVITRKVGRNCIMHILDVVTRVSAAIVEQLVE